MLLVICTVEVFMNGSIILGKADLEGKVIKQNSTKYYVDFSKDAKKKDLHVWNSDDGKIMVDKSECVVK